MSKQNMIVLDLRGPMGNAFSIMGVCSKIYKKLPELVKAMDPIENKTFEQITEEMTSGSYEDLLEVAEKYFGNYIYFTGQ